jgi:antitoxin ParD1/3/4
MAQHPDRRSTTLSISLPPQLAAKVTERVDSGLYASASELVREALRHLLEMENRRAVQTPGDKLNAALELQDLGLAMTAQRLRRENPGLTEEELLAQVQALSADDIDVGLKPAPERLKRLRLHGTHE